MNITKKAVRVGAQVQFEIMNGKRPSDPDKFESPEDFVEHLKWYDNFYAEAFPRYCAHFKAGMIAALREMEERNK